MKKDAFIIPLFGALLWFGNYHHLLKALGRYDQNYWFDCYLGAVLIAFFLRHLINEKRELSELNNVDNIIDDIKYYAIALFETVKKYILWAVLALVIFGQG